MSSLGVNCFSFLRARFLGRMAWSAFPKFDRVSDGLLFELANGRKSCKGAGD